VIYAVDEPLDATQCRGKENCNDDQRCMTHDLWANLNRVMVDYLDSVTLQQLVEQQRERMARSGVSVAALQDNRGLRDRANAGKAPKPVVALT
jgi:Rrf2 family iron-sulfur cluster assembly transcriptional regulator